MYMLHHNLMLSDPIASHLISSCRGSQDGKGAAVQYARSAFPLFASSPEQALAPEAAPLPRTPFQQPRCAPLAEALCAAGCASLLPPAGACWRRLEAAGGGFVAGFGGSTVLYRLRALCASGPCCVL